MNAKRTGKTPSNATASQVFSVRLHPAVIERLDELIGQLQSSRKYQLEGIDSRMDVLRLALKEGIAVIEKELSK